MSAEAVFTVIVGLLAAIVLVLVALAVPRGRQRPARLGPWIAALVLAVVPALLFTAVAVSAIVAGEGWWVLIGFAGLWSLVALAVLRPRWAAWAFIGSGVALPVLLATSALLIATGEPMIDLGHAIGFYTIRALVTGALLMWAGSTRATTPSTDRRPAAVG